MTREEAIKILRDTHDKALFSVRNALETLIPELCESEDERIRKGLIEALKASKTVGELKFILPEPTREECIAYLEKQKDVSKAIEAVDRIDKYIDKNVANAHDMKDSNPDKKYYLGWDDALAEMARILQDVYSNEKQKEQKPEQYSPLCNTIKDKIREYVANHFATDTVVKTDVKSIVKAMEEGVRLGKEEQKPAEWSEEDEHNLNSVISLVHSTSDGAWGSCIGDRIENWLKSLRPSWKPSEEQMDRLFSIIAALRKDYCDDMADFLANLRAGLKKLGVKEEPEYYQHFDPDC